MKNIIILLIISLLAISCKPKIDSQDLTNDIASLPSALIFSKSGLKVINSSINKAQGTMSTLYGNQLALINFKSDSNKLAPGEVIELITWKQQADEHWFGANIPGNLQALEVIKTGLGPLASTTYYRFLGRTLKPDNDTTKNQSRINYIFEQKASVMP